MVHSREETLAPLIPVSVLSARWHSHDSETASEENFYDVPRCARHRLVQEQQQQQQQQIHRNHVKRPRTLAPYHSCMSH